MMLPDIGRIIKVEKFLNPKKSIAKPDLFWNVTPNGKETNRKEIMQNSKNEAFTTRGSYI